jgi:hypothetical protein
MVDVIVFISLKTKFIYFSTLYLCKWYSQKWNKADLILRFMFFATYSAIFKNWNKI